MKGIHIYLVSLLFLLMRTALAQDAPITISGSVLDAAPGPINIPISVTDFEDIKSITLALNFDPAVIQFVNSTANPVFNNIQITSNTPGVVVIGWFSLASSVTLPDESVLASLNFTYVSGTTALSWDNTSSGGSACEYTDGTYTILNDDPTADFYFDGVVTSQSAPITYAPALTNVGAGAFDVPITVENFTKIGAIALSLEYDPNVITYNSFVANAVFGGNLIVTSSPSTGSKNKIIISWISTGVSASKSLPDLSTIVDLNFSYVAGLFSANHTILEWLTDGTACQYGDSTYLALHDIPYDNYYIDGLVAAQVAPGTYLPEIITAVAGSIDVPVTTVGFQNIGAVALVFEYDANVMTYAGYTPNAAFGGSLLTSNQVTGTTGELTISYFGSPVSITDLDEIVNIEFTYTSGTTTLDWKTNGTDCQYGDVSFNYLWDKPYEDYYFDGLVAGQVAPTIKADSMSGSAGTQITVPVRVWGFNNISAMTLHLDYDPGVLNYTGAAPHQDITTNFSEGITNPGRVQIGWFNFNPVANPVNLADETVLFYLNFDYIGGESPLIWYENGPSCEFTVGGSYAVLHDMPIADHYIDGLVGLADFIWIGGTSTDWMTPVNWSDNMVPNSLSIVSIPTTPPTFWPVFTGDFILGDQCQQINLGPSSEMSVTGDMNIHPGKAFINEGSGMLTIGGDWSNTGVFDAGTGKVIFDGSGNIPPVLPAKQVQNYQLSTIPASMTAISGNPGPSGDNAHSDVSIGFSFNYAGTDFTQARINTNGWLSLDLSGADISSNDNNILFFAADPTNTLAPWWDNLKADGMTSISYVTSGAASNRVFTVEWNNILAYSTTSTTRLNFQVKLYETTNLIEFCYGSTSIGTASPSEGASIGIKGLVGGAGDFIEATTATTNTLITNLISTADWPTVNYLFTPPPDTVAFYQLTVSPGATLNVQTDVNVTD